MRRVLILVENCSVPLDRRVWKISKALTERGYKIIVICPRGDRIDSLPREKIEGISIYRYRAFEAKEGLLSYIFEYTQAIVKMFLLSILVFIREGFDIIHVCNPPDLLFLVACPFKLMGRRVVFDQHDLSPELYLSKANSDSTNIIYRALLLLERVSLKIADAIIVTNESYKRIAVTRGRISNKHVFIVRNDPQPDLFKTAQPNQALKNGKHNLIFYVGQIAQQDGVDYLLRSIRYLHKVRKRDDFHLLIMGGGTELDRLKQFASDLGISDLLTFTGLVPHSQVISALPAADICVSPDPKTLQNDASTMIKVVEYMAAGKPIVAYDLTETRVSAGDAALYAKPNDEQDFAEKIAQLLDSPELRKKLGRIGEKRILNGLSWHHSKRHLFDAYRSALSKHRR